MIFINFLIYFLVRILHSTYRYQYSGEDNLNQLRKIKKKYILAIWHQGLLPGIFAQIGHKHVVIISKSKDAEVVAYTCHKFGHHVVRGSSKKNGVNKNGKEAKEMMIEILRSGCPGAVTVDGPKGPCFVVKPGIVDMAKEADCAIVPYTATPKSFWEFNSWDHFRLPKPFSKILISYGKPIFISQDKSLFEEERLLIEAALLSEKKLSDVQMQIK